MGRKLIMLLAMVVLAVGMTTATAQAATWSPKSSYVQASCYGPYEGETITATGKCITNSTKYIAVPSSMIVSKSTWRKLSKKQRYRRFYYGERIRLWKGKKHITATVQDCGGFAGCGGTYRGKWRDRLFDCTPAVFNSLGFRGTAFLQFQYMR